MDITRQIEEIEYEEQGGKAGTWSTGHEDRDGHGRKLGEKRRFRDTCDTGWGEAAEEGLLEVGAAGGEKLEDKRQEETKL